MLPQTQPRKRRNSSRVSLFISVVFHGALVFALVYFAARSGMIGERLRKLTVSMVKEPPPEKPKEPEKPVDVPRPEPDRVEPRKTVEIPAVSPPPAALPAPTAPPVMAPAPANLPSFSFDDGAKPVETATPAGIYRQLVEYTLRANWDRPTDLTDETFAAEVEIEVDVSGNITARGWKKESGNRRWDDSVRKAIASTPALSRPPPADFPGKVVVRFDTVSESDHAFQ
jgi:TonB C terminal